MSLQDKVLPFLVNLDIEMVAWEKLIRTNIDMARISEAKVEWLLRFNKYKLEMREMLSSLSGPVYEDLESVLSLRYRANIVRNRKARAHNTLTHLIYNFCQKYDTKLALIQIIWHVIIALVIDKPVDLYIVYLKNTTAA
ncbi:unnamed protein product [Gongylonema pulchrum]|uniref:Uncharacterized protein n=1 Tax=Gongylonema pulchrum TaxID=637853 RepID=A0A3P7NSY3_9BILA|nr:unnamed protein product [Gongylonema pulchrum]